MLQEIDLKVPLPLPSDPSALNFALPAMSEMGTPL